MSEREREREKEKKREREREREGGREREREIVTSYHSNISDKNRFIPHITKLKVSSIILTCKQKFSQYFSHFTLVNYEKITSSFILYFLFGVNGNDINLTFFNKTFISGIKDAVTHMRYFARRKFSVSLVHNKNFSLI